MADPTRVTLNDLAAASGVSRATVSFVLRDSPGQSISAATKDRVREAARALGYVPHGLARALREGTSTIVVLAIDPALEGNYARSYIAGLDAEPAATTTCCSSAIPRANASAPTPSRPTRTSRRPVAPRGAAVRRALPDRPGAR